MNHQLKFKNMRTGDKVFDIVNYTLLTLIMVIVLYPVLYIVAASFSDPQAVVSGEVFILPVRPTLRGYEAVFKNKKILTGFANSVYYLVVGTLLNLVMTMLCAYPLSRKEFRARGGIAMFFVFTMYFSGGLIPSYLIVKQLGLLDTRTIMIILGSVSVYNIILIRTFFLNTIPKELQEAASIDGCGYGRFFMQIALPLSKAIIAVIALYLVVGYWNSYFTALIYLQDNSKKPLQLFLREILLVSTESMKQQTENAEAMAEYQRLLEVIKYAVIVVSTLPVMCIYPFLQKYFVQGVMIGSLKG